MGKKLVIVESPAKAKTINKILGRDFVVRASMGHVRDLPEKNLGIDVEHDFKPKYVTIKSREKVLKELRKEAEDAETIYLAPDPDREGEAIAWHLMAALGKKKAERDRFVRVTYNEITAQAIRKAFAEPRPIDQHKVDSQQARRLLDRLVGYRISPLVWRRVRGASSAGRVQSVALRLVCEREREILNFKPEEYWLLGARVRKQVDPRDPFRIRLARINGEKAEIKTGEQAKAVREDLEGRSLRVSNIIPRELTRRAMPPFITSTMQQAASGACGFAPAYTMKLAQKLYEGVDLGEGAVGLITYMRTDSVNVSGEAQEACRGFVREVYGPAYVPEKPNVYRSRASAQEAHEAIRPTDVRRTPDEMAAVLDKDELRLYRLVWQRFVASQMSPAKIAQRTVEVEAQPPAEGRSTSLAADFSTYLFRATASEVVFPGYMKVTGAEQRRKGDNGDEEEEKLPPLDVGELLEHLEWLEEQKFTQPPPRYTEASLVRALEENGVGRPSTYAQILSTIVQRKYVIREKRQLRPTDMGFKVSDFLVGHLGELFDVGFTASMEEELDEIEGGSVDWVTMMGQFYGKLQGWIERAKGPPADPALVRRLLDIMGTVKEWAPPTKRGKRTYSDQAFVESIRKQLDEGKAISERQLEALRKLACRYRAQIPGLEAAAAELGLEEHLEAAKRPPEPPREETLRKLELLLGIAFAEPRQVGKRVYDDKAFSDSLRRQVEEGRRLSPNQIRYLDRLVMKYKKQIPDFERLVSDLGLDADHAREDASSGPLLEALKAVTEWKPPVQRGRRTWDDRKFYESLSRQFAQHKGLTPRQAASLKKLVRRYREQVPGYEELARQHGIPSKTRAPAGAAGGAGDAS